MSETTPARIEKRLRVMGWVACSTIYDRRLIPRYVCWRGVRHQLASRAWALGSNVGRNSARPNCRALAAGWWQVIYS